MSIECKPVGVACNLKCPYCYETSMRDNPANRVRFDKEKMLKILESAKHEWSLFGGEPLILPLDDIIELLEVGFKKFQRTGIQTNGTLITNEHIAAFQKFKTSIGISMDGPEELNDSRWAGTVEHTRRATAKSMWALERLCELSKTPGNESLLPSLIITLHAGNASKERWPKFVEWIRHLDRIGIKHVNLHVMEMDHHASDLYLPLDELMARQSDLWKLQRELKNVDFFQFKEIIKLLSGEDATAVCVWHACDPWNTAAVQGIEGDGSPSVCGRTNKDGVSWVPAEGVGVPAKHQSGIFDHGARYHERQLSLHVTPQEHGGCKDCRFWMMCLGQCPGTGDASDTYDQGDWRLRSSYCEVWKHMFTEGEKALLDTGVQPVSLWKNRPDLEARMYAHWLNGQEPSMSGVIAESRGQLAKWHDATGHGDHSDAAATRPTGGCGHGDAPHGDAPHGDSNHIEQ